MRFKGYKITIRCLDWEQVDTIDNYWHLFAKHIDRKNIVGLGFNWSDDKLYFDYAIGVISDEETLKELTKIDFTNTNIKPEYIELDLPGLNEWMTFKGKDYEVKTIYEVEIDSKSKDYDYELEYIDGKGNIEIKIHFTEDR